MNAEEIKLKKAELRQQKQQADRRAGEAIVLSLIENPMFGLVAGVVFLELLEKEGIMGRWITPLTESALFGVAIGKAMAPALPYIGEAAAPLVKAATKIL